jgi:hypothetical protein
MPKISSGAGSSNAAPAPAPAPAPVSGSSACDALSAPAFDAPEIFSSGAGSSNDANAPAPDASNINAPSSNACAGVCAAVSLFLAAVLMMGNAIFCGNEASNISRQHLHSSDGVDVNVYLTGLFAYLSGVTTPFAVMFACLGVQALDVLSQVPAAPLPTSVAGAGRAAVSSATGFAGRVGRAAVSAVSSVTSFTDRFRRAGRADQNIPNAQVIGNQNDDIELAQASASLSRG